MVFSAAWRRGLSALAAASIAAGLAVAPGSAAGAAASNCPAVSGTGTVTPAPSPGVDWSGCNLVGANMSGADLSSADLSDAKLGGANLSNANLNGANLSTFYLENVTLTGANLSGTQFAYNGDLSGVVSGRITGTPASLPYYPNGQYVLGGGYLAGPGAYLAGADLAGVNLSGAYLVQNADLAGANLTGANLSDGAVSADLSGAILAGANLTRLVSYYSTGTPESLPAHWALAGGYLLGPTVLVIGQNLVGYDLAGLDLTGAQLNLSNLTSANLSHANLTSTYLWFTNLTGATVTGASFTGASWNATICPDGTSSDIHIDGCFSPRDTTPPVLHLNVRNGQVFAVGSVRAVRCAVTDKYSPIVVNPTLKITGRSSHGLGKFTATCSGAKDRAGNVARPVSAAYWVGYGFDGMHLGQGSTVPVSPRVRTVTFGLSGPVRAIPAATARAMVRRHDVRVTLRGPGIRPATAVCGSYSARVGFVCRLRLPHVRTGRRYRYTLTAYENDGFGLVVAPGELTALNPVTIHFR